MPNKCYAAVDMGTNSFHLIIVKLKKDGSFKVIDREREIIRLGSHQGEELSIISAQETARAVKILSGFRKLTEFYGAELRAVATSAVRESHNREDFIKQVRNETGVEVEVIEGRHEAQLIYLGAKKALKLFDKRVLCIDIGGGSTEFVLGENGKSVFAESIKIGAVRLSKKFFPDYVLSDYEIAECKKFIVERISSNKKIKKKMKLDLAVGTSGTIQAAAAMAYRLKSDKPQKSLNGYSFTVSELQEITAMVLSHKRPEQRLTIKGMEAKRADIIPAGLLVLNEVFEIFDLKSMTISDYALREGIILEMMGETVIN